MTGPIAGDNPAARRSSEGKPQLSLCMIVRNERQNLERCLNSVADLVDEVVVVDTGSDDGTQEIARGFGARVIQSAWNHDFSAARNLSLQQARGKWILVLDADELLLEPDKAGIRKLLAKYTPAQGTPSTAFNLVNKSSSDGGRSGMTAHLIRLFPNRADVRYRWPIHEQIAPSLTQAGVPIVDTDVVILHTGYTDSVRNRAKQQRNLAILQAQVAAGNEVTPLTHFMIGGCYLDLGELEPALVAYQDAVAAARGLPDQEDIGRGATVRIVECLVKLKRYREAIDLAPGAPDSSWHPELLTLRAQAEAGLGRADEAKRCYEAVFTCADTPRIPACNLANLKIEALGFLGQYWHQRGQAQRAVTLLRRAMALRNDGRDFTARDLETCYQS
jgi:tetratricopeptide (TPR) repeat protein